MILLGTGVALHEPAVYAALGAAAEGKRDRLLMRQVQALNFGGVFGPGLALVAGWSTTASFLIAAAATRRVALWAVPMMLPAPQRFGPRPILIAGCAMSATSIGVLDTSVALAGVMTLVVARLVAETAVTPAADVLTACHAAGRDVASRFGILAVGTGVGTALGTPLGVRAANGAPAMLAALGVFGAISCAAALKCISLGEKGETSCRAVAFK